MTNLEWIKNDNERLKDVLTHSLAVNTDTGKVVRCSEIACCNCSFSGHGHVHCNDLREEWLNKEHEHKPLYKKGDVVITRAGYIYFVIEDRGNGIVISNNKFDLNTGLGTFKIKDDLDIERKVGNIFDIKEV